MDNMLDEILVLCVALLVTSCSSVAGVEHSSPAPMVSWQFPSGNSVIGLT